MMQFGPATELKLIYDSLLKTKDRLEEELAETNKRLEQYQKAIVLIVENTGGDIE